MDGLAFVPWIGKNYEKDGLDGSGLRVMLLGESHYGPTHHARREVTPEVTRWLGQSTRKAFYTRMAYAVLNETWLTMEERAAFFEDVCLYNFVQEFLPDVGDRPTDAQWRSAAKVLPGVVDVLKPDVIVVFGKEMQEFALPAIPHEISYVAVNHPSRGFKQSHWKPIIAAKLETARAALSARHGQQPRLSNDPIFAEWRDISANARVRLLAELDAGLSTPLA